MDLRRFYRPDARTVVAVFRLGHRAAIAHHMYTTAHGGSIETVLDQTTAEVVKGVSPPRNHRDEGPPQKVAGAVQDLSRDVEITDASEFKISPRRHDPSNPNIPLASERLPLAHMQF